MTVEIQDANEAVSIIKEPSVYVNWAPGDATRYRVSFVVNVAYATFDSLDVEYDLCYLTVLRGDQVSGLLLERPGSSDQLWTPDLFLRRFGPDYAGWWSGVRPLLAALEWTAETCSSTDYDGNDATEMALLLGDYEN